MLPEGFACSRRGPFGSSLRVARRLRARKPSERANIKASNAASEKVPGEGHQRVKKSHGEGYEQQCSPAIKGGEQGEVAPGEVGQRGGDSL